ncbi:MAG: hypothetical protein DMG04_23255 [Acidobacteria bacterium]|nr:MAG: hypothetical protein DMG04_23255 [Acidobacteriota bacterium]
MEFRQSSRVILITQNHNTSAIALNLLFHVPLTWGVTLTALDVLIVLFLQHRGFRYVEALVVGLILAIAGSFAIEMWLSRPDLAAVTTGFVPRGGILRDSQMLYIAIGILGATVMPHNLYLHSSIVQTRKYADTTPSKAEAIRYSTIDSSNAVALSIEHLWALAGLSLPIHVSNDRELRIACDLFRQRIRVGRGEFESEMVQTVSEILDDITDDERKRFGGDLLRARLYQDLIRVVRIVFGPLGMTVGFVEPIPHMTTELVQVMTRSTELQEMIGKHDQDSEDKKG